MNHQVRQWTNPSVTALAEGDDPIRVIQNKARDLVLDAAENGWQGPPYNPFTLADLIGINVTPNDDIFDGRVVATDVGLRIEYNPHRPHERIRFSVAHEIAHTLFPDCADRVRNREQAGWFGEDEWQIELLCNLGAAEILMPSGYVQLESEAVDINSLMKLRRELDVSTEALLLRFVKLTSQPCAMFAAARLGGVGDPSYRIDYSVPSRTWSFSAPHHFRVEQSAALARCTAIGYTAKERESWDSSLPEFDVECVGIPPFPGSMFPRVVGVITSKEDPGFEPLQIIHLFGDATEPSGSGPRVIAHIVNDTTPNWGGGFALEVRKRWRFVQDDFREWVEMDSSNLALGNVHHSVIGENLSVVHMIAQQGYGSSNRLRIRYGALAQALDHLEAIASELGASVHMPRIGTGQAGGNWELIQELIDERLVRRGIGVTVYTLPESVSIDIQGRFSL